MFAADSIENYRKFIDDYARRHDALPLETFSTFSPTFTKWNTDAVVFLETNPKSELLKQYMRMPLNDHEGRLFFDARKRITYVLRATKTPTSQKVEFDRLDAVLKMLCVSDGSTLKIINANF